MTGMLQETLAENLADAPFAVDVVDRDRVESPVEPADVGGGGGWSEDDIDYIAAGGLTVPGQGDRSKGCGDYLPLKYCPKCGESEMLEKRCKQRTCPSCHTIWTGEQAERATVRMVAAREAQPDGLERRAVHAVATVPPGEIETIVQFRQGAKRAYELAKEHGVRGGVVVPHAFRVEDSVKAEYRAVEPDMGIWRWLLDHREEEWRTAVYFSPHYHIIGLAEDIAASSPEEDGGWNFKRIRSLERHNRRRESSYEDVYGVLYYLLTHASFDPAESNHVLRWFGTLSYRSFSPEDLPDWKVSQISRMARLQREEAMVEQPEYECREDSCHGRLEATYGNARDRLMDQEWCERVGRVKVRRLHLAVDWLAGMKRPPPGLKHPRTQGQAREALDVMYEREYGDAHPSG